MLRRCLPLLPWVVACLLVSLCDSQSHAQDRLNWFWRPYAELGIRGGDELERGQTNLFLPVHQSQTNILFADIAGNWTDSRSAQGNFGLAFRQMLVNDWIFGIHSSYDVRHTEAGNNFGRATLGLEMLNSNWGVRWNGYLAEDNTELVGSLTQAVVQDVGGVDRLFVQQSFERAYSGQEFEVESRLWARNSPSDNATTGWTSFLDFEIWAAIGVYNYDTDAAGFGSMTGPRGRVELRMFDIPWAGPDSRLVFAGQFEDDDVRGDVSSASMVVRIPFGRGTDYPRTRLRGLNRRMVAPLVRQRDIITSVAVGEADRAVFAKTGELVGDIVRVDSGTASAETAISNAGANSLVLLDGGTSGVINTAAPINLNSGQVLLGGGGTLQLTGANSNASVNFTAPGSRPTFDSTAGSVFSLTNDNNCIIGVDVASSTPNATLIQVNGAAGTLLQDLSVAATGVNSTALSAIGNSVIDVVGSSFSTTADNSPAITVGDSFVGLQNSLLFTSGVGSAGIEANASAQLAVSNSVITTTESGSLPSGIEATTAGGSLALAVTNSTINSTGRAIALGGGGFNGGRVDATIVSNTLSSPTGTNELEAFTNGGDLNLSAQGNSMDPLVGTIRLDNGGGTLNVNQSASGFGTANGIAPTNVITTGTINFQSTDAPLLPTR